MEATPEIVEGIRRIHEAYTFPPEAYHFVGLDTATPRKAGVIETKRDAARNAAPGRVGARPRSKRLVAKAQPVKAARRGAA